MNFVLSKIIEKEVRKVISILQEGIVHLDKMRPNDLLDFLKSWNINSSAFHISEKMDGNYMALGVDKGRFYLRSKSKFFTSPEEVPDIYFMSDFKRYFLLLQSLPWNEIFGKMAKKYNFTFNGTFEIEGEAIPSFDHNIVIYDKAKIGDGVFIIFNSKTSIGKDKTGRMHNVDMWKDIANELNSLGKVKFYAVPEVSMNDFKFRNDIVVDLEELIKKHGNFLKKPARKPEDKELKKKILNKVSIIGMDAKNQALKYNVNGKFGPEIEGVVITGPDGKLVKIVDTNKFTERKNKNWHYIDKIITAEKTFKKGIKEHPKNLEHLLTNWEAEIFDIKKDFEHNHKKYISINKKIGDTKNAIEYASGIIRSIKNKIKNGIPLEKIVEDFNNRKILPEIFSFSNNQIIQEGGNIFDSSNSIVPKKFSIPTIKNALSISGLSNMPFEIVGNKTKEYFNDIDIGIDAKNLGEMLNTQINNKKDFWAALDEHLSNSDVEDYTINKGLSQVNILVPLVNNKGDQIKSILPDKSLGSEPAMIQMDIFIGNLQWIANISSGAPEMSKYKAVFRNILLSSMSRNILLPVKNKNDEYYRYVINFRTGLRIQKIKTVPPTGRQKKPKKVKLFDKTITTDVDKMAKIFFGPNTKWEDINSYEKLLGLLKSNKFKYKNFLKNILEDFKKSANI